MYIIKVGLCKVWCFLTYFVLKLLKKIKPSGAQLGKGRVKSGTVGYSNKILISDGIFSVGKMIKLILLNW